MTGPFISRSNARTAGSKVAALAGRVHREPWLCRAFAGRLTRRAKRRAPAQAARHTQPHTPVHCIASVSNADESCIARSSRESVRGKSSRRSAQLATDLPFLPPTPVSDSQHGGYSSARLCAASWIYFTNCSVNAVRVCFFVVAIGPRPVLNSQPVTHPSSLRQS